jgi:ABC-type glycerol-3-phosphate transport system substrate-binding protein
MKRVHPLMLIVLAVLLALSIAACTSPAPTAEVETVTITFACKDYQRDRYGDLAQEFHKLHPAIGVELVSIDEVLGRGSSGGVITASTDDVYKIAAAADTFVDSAYVLEWVAPQDIVLDLTELAEQDERFSLDDFYAGPVTLFQRGGKLWGLPLEAHVLLTFYNPKLFDAADVPYPHIGWSWDDFLDAASRLTIRDGETVRQYGYMDPAPFYTLPLFAHQKAGRLIDQNQDPPVARLDVPGVIEAVQWYADLILVHGVMPNPVTMDSLARQRFPYEQSPAMWVGFSYEMDNFEHLYDARVVSFPEAGEAAADVSANGYFISAGTVYPEAAWRWIEFLSRQPVERYGGGVPARKSVAEEMHYWKTLGDDTAAVYQYALEHVGNLSEIRGALKNAWTAVLEGEPVEVALAAAQERVNAQLAQAAAEAQRPPAKVAVATPLPTPTPGGTLIRFLASYGTDLTPHRTLARRFQEAHPEITVEVLAGGGNTLAEQAATADCFAWYAFGLGQDAGTLLALDPFLADDETLDLNGFPPAFLEPVRIDGTLWALPLEADAWLLYYNRDLFDEVGAPYPAADWTPQQLIEQAIALTDQSAPQPIYGFYPRDGAYADAPEYVAWLGGRLFDADGRPTLDDPSVSEALASYVDLIVRATPPSAQERGGNRWSGYSTWFGAHPGPVSLGRVAMWTDLYGNHGGAPSLDFNVGVVPLPAGAVPLADLVSRALFISAQTPHAAACWDWIAFLSTQPEVVSWLPVHRDVAASEAWRERAGAGTADAWLTILDRIETLQRPWATSMGYYALYWFDEALADVLAGAWPSAALAEAQSKATAFTDCIVGSEYSQESIHACARQADPGVVLPGE